MAAAGVAAAAAFAATPASAAFFFICGMFADGGSVKGTIQLDDITGNFISLLNTTTTETPGFINPITYTTADFISQSIVPAETNPPVDPPINAFETHRYIFSQGPNTLQINYATSLFPNNFPSIGDLSGPIMISREFRNSIPRSASDIDIQVPPPVPGPLPILGAAAAFGFSRNIRKRIKSANS